MSMEFAVTLLTGLVGVGVSILMAGIPWAYSMHGRLTKIETILNEHVHGYHRVNGMQDRLTKLEARLYDDGDNCR